MENFNKLNLRDGDIITEDKLAIIDSNTDKYNANKTEILNTIGDEEMGTTATTLKGGIAEVNSHLNENTQNLENFKTDISNNYAKKTDVNILASNKAENTTVQALQTQVNSIASGSPKAVSLVSQMTDTTKNYVYTGSETGYTNGNWYYYSGSAWVSGGSYQSTGIENNSIENNKLKPLTFRKLNFMKCGKNLFDEKSLIQGYYMQTNGTLLASDIYAVTDFIPVTPGSSLVFWRNLNEADPRRSVRIATYFNNNFEVLTSLGYDNTSNTTEPVIVPNDSNVAYVRLSVFKNYADGRTMLEYSPIPTTFENFKLKIEDLDINDNLLKTSNNPLYGKKVLSFGDSIMRGAGNNNVGLADIIAKRNNMTCYNEAVSGATIMTTQDNNIPKQITNSTVTNPDYIIMDGYVNDCYPSILDKLGSVSPYFGSTFDTSTFCGQLETSLKELQNKYVGSKIVYIFVHKMNTRDDSIVKQVHELAKECCHKWSIAIVDIYEEGILNTYIEGYRALYTGNNGDGTHPNQLGYEKYYVPAVESRMKIM